MSVWEFLTIIIVALLVIRPKQLPTLAYHGGKCYQRVKRIVGKWQTTLQHEMRQTELNLKLKDNITRAKQAEQTAKQTQTTRQSTDSS